MQLHNLEARTTEAAVRRFNPVRIKDIASPIRLWLALVALAVMGAWAPVANAVDGVPAINMGSITLADDGSVSVAFAVTDPEGGTVRYDAYLSNNGGTATGFQPASQKSATYLASGSLQTVTWPAAQVPALLTDGGSYTIQVDGFDVANNQGTGYSQLFIWHANTTPATLSFPDVNPASWSASYINAIRDAGITTGCGNGNYCPSNPVTREQMAAFLIRAKAGEPPANYCQGTSSFLDVSAVAWSCGYVKWLSELAITTGCSSGAYCPSVNVNRQQMAAFIVRAMEGEPPSNYCDGGSPFADVPASNPMCGYIKRLFELGVTTGCGNGNYCPGNPVTREQMAAFLARAFLGVTTTNAWDNPLNLVELSAKDTHSISASWLPVNDGATPEANITYELHLSTVDGFLPDAATLVAQGAAMHSAQVSGLLANTLYYARVRALGASGQRITSAQIQVRTAALDTILNAGATVRVMSASEATEIAPDRFLLAVGIAAPAVGSLIVNANQSGYFKKVLAVTTDVAGQTVLETVPAGLHEMFEQLEINSRIELAAVPPLAARVATAGRSNSARLSTALDGQARLDWPDTGFSLESPPASPMSSPSKRPYMGDLEGKLRVAAKAGQPLYSETTVRQTVSGKWASVTGTQGIAIVPGNSGATQIKLKVVKDDETIFTGVRIPIAICKVADLEVEAPGGKSSAGLVTMGTFTATKQEVVADYGGGYYTATREATQYLHIQATEQQESPEPYKVRFTAYIDEAGNGCVDSPRAILGWKERIHFELPIYVAKEPNFPSDEVHDLSFQGGFRVDNKVTFTFTPEIEPQISIANHVVKKASIVAKTNALLNQQLTITASGAATLDVTRNLIPERKFIKVYMAGNIPIVMSGSFAADLRVQGKAKGVITAKEALEMGFDNLEFGFEYANGAWHTVQHVKPVYTLKLSGEADAEATVTLSLLPRLKVTFYEALTGRLLVEPYLTAEAGIHGQVRADFVPEGVTTDADYWLTKGALNGGLNAYLFANVEGCGFSFCKWPNTANETDYTTYHKIELIAPTPILGIPGLTATPYMNHEHPADSRAMLIQGAYTEVPNPFRAIFGGPAAFIRFGEWTRPKVIALNDTGYQVLDTLNSAPDEAWIVFDQPGTYTVRLGGYSSLGGWARQVAETTLNLTDSDHDGMLDWWENHYGLTDPAGDADGDGLSNLAEFQSGTCPVCVGNRLIVTKLGTGSGEVVSAPAGIQCGMDCAENYTDGVTVTLTAVPDVDSIFLGWGGACAAYGANGVCTLPINGNQTALAYFKLVGPDRIARLNDTGITWCGAAIDGNAACAGSQPAGQDAHYGRDALAAAGLLNKIGGGQAGFDFTALDASGNPTTPSSGANPHPCVRDNVTGLWWEVKTDDGGLRDKDWTYTWYNSASPDGNPGTASGGSCYQSGRCDTEKYVADVNAAGLCGHHDWRMPTVKELEGIADLGIAYPGPTIDTSYFPNSPSSSFWSGSPSAHNSDGAWGVDFYGGLANDDGRGYGFSVRLVRGGQ